MHARSSRSLAVSVAVHAAVLLAFVLPSRSRRDNGTRMPDRGDEMAFDLVPAVTATRAPVTPTRSTAEITVHPSNRARTTARAPDRTAPLATPSIATPVEPAARAPAAPGPLDAMDLLRGMDHDAYVAAFDQHAISLPAPGSGHASRELFANEDDRGASTDARTRGPLQAYFTGLLGASNHALEPPGTPAYLHALRRRIEAGWQPRDTRAPSTARQWTGMLVTTTDEAQDTARRAMGILGYGSGAAAIASLAAAHPNSDGVQDLRAAGLSASLGVVTHEPPTVTTSQIVLEQDPRGRVLSARVLLPSGQRGFDAAALAAVTEAVARTPVGSMPGGRRSIWLFRVERTSHPAAPVLGGTFDEVRMTLTFLHPPGQNQYRAHVQLLSSRPLQG